MTSRRHFIAWVSSLPFVAYFTAKASAVPPTNPKDWISAEQIEESRAICAASDKIISVTDGEGMTVVAHSPIMKLTRLEVLLYDMLQEMEVLKAWPVYGNFRLVGSGRSYNFAIPSLKLGFMIYNPQFALPHRDNYAENDQRFYEKDGWRTIHLNEYMLTHYKDETMKHVSVMIDQQVWKAEEGEI